MPHHAAGGDLVAASVEDDQHGQQEQQADHDRAMTTARVVPTDPAPVRRDIVAADAVDAAARSLDSNAARDAE